MFYSTFLLGRSRFDLARWAADLMQQWELTREYGFHLIVWDHDEHCPLNPGTSTAIVPSARCRCQPNGTLVLHAGCADERRIPVVVEGVALPVQPQG
jgi:hypothetical protein